SDPLGVLHHGKTAAAPLEWTADDETPGTVRAALQGTIVAIEVAEGDLVPAGATLLVMEAMKMEHVVTAPIAGRVLPAVGALGDAVREGAPLGVLREAAGAGAAGRARE